MHDMLVRLYALPSLDEAVAACAARGTMIRRALAPEKHAVLAFVRAHFASSTAEVETAFAHVPATCFIAISSGRRAWPQGSAGVALVVRSCSPRCMRNGRKGTRTRSSVALVLRSSTRRRQAR
jgi:hypothetical protein